MTLSSLSLFACCRCGRAAPVDLDEITGDGGGDPALLPLVIAPEGEGWLVVDDTKTSSEGLACPRCVTREEAFEHSADLGDLDDYCCWMWRDDYRRWLARVERGERDEDAE